jgi:hypothetical protein
MDLVRSVKKNQANLLSPSASSGVRFCHHNEGEQPAQQRAKLVTQQRLTYRPGKSSDESPHLGQAREEGSRARTRAVIHEVGIGH